MKSHVKSRRCEWGLKPRSWLLCTTAPDSGCASFSNSTPLGCTAQGEASWPTLDYSSQAIPVILQCLWTRQSFYVIFASFFLAFSKQPNSFWLACRNWGVAWPRWECPVLITMLAALICSHVLLFCAEYEWCDLPLIIWKDFLVLSVGAGFPLNTRCSALRFLPQTQAGIWYWLYSYQYFQMSFRSEKGTSLSSGPTTSHK